MMKKIFFSAFVMYSSFIKISLAVIFIDVRNDNIFSHGLRDKPTKNVSIVAFDIDKQIFLDLSQFGSSSDSELGEIKYTASNDMLSFKPDNVQAGFTVNGAGAITLTEGFPRKVMLRTFSKNITTNVSSQESRIKDWGEGKILRPSSNSHLTIGEGVADKLTDYEGKHFNNSAVNYYKFDDKTEKYNNLEAINIFKAHNKIKGALGEIALEMMMVNWRFQVLDCKVGDDQGFDGVFRSQNQQDKPTNDALFLTESKFERSPRSVEAILDQYISEVVIQRRLECLQEEEDDSKKRNAQEISQFLQENASNVWLIAHKIKIPKKEVEWKNGAEVSFFMRKFNPHFHTLVLQRNLKAHSIWTYKERFLDNLIHQQIIEHELFLKAELEDIRGFHTNYQNFFQDIANLIDINSAPWKTYLTDKHKEEEFKELSNQKKRYEKSLDQINRNYGQEQSLTGLTGDKDFNNLKNAKGLLQRQGDQFLSLASSFKESDEEFLKKIENLKNEYKARDQEIQREINSKQENLINTVKSAAERDVFFMMCERIYNGTDELISLGAHLLTVVDKSNRGRRRTPKATTWGEVVPTFSQAPDALSKFDELKKCIIAAHPSGEKAKSKKRREGKDIKVKG